MSDFALNFIDYGLAVLVVVSFLVYGLPRVVKYMDQKNEKYIAVVNELNQRHLKQLEELTNSHEQKMTIAANEYERRLDLKDSRINEIVDQTYKAIHDFKSVLDKQNGLIVDVREDVKPIKAMQPFIQSIAEKIDQLVNLEKK